VTGLDALQTMLPHRTPPEAGGAAPAEASMGDGDGVTFALLLDGLSKPADERPKSPEMPAPEPGRRPLRHVAPPLLTVEPINDADPETSRMPDEPDAADSLVQDTGEETAPIQPAPAAPDAQGPWTAFTTLFRTAGPRVIADPAAPRVVADPAAPMRTDLGQVIAAEPDQPPTLKATILSRETHFAPVLQPVLQPVLNSRPVSQPDEPILPEPGAPEERSADETRETESAPPRSADPPDRQPASRNTVAPQLRRAADAGPAPPLPVAATALPLPVDTQPERPFASLPRQVADAIAARIPPPPAAGTMAAPGPVRVMTIRLDPAELGAVTVRMRLAGGALELHFHAETEATADLLERDRHALSEILRASGYEPGLLSVSQRPAMPALTGQPAVPLAAPDFPQPSGMATGEQGGQPRQDKRDRPDQAAPQQGNNDDDNPARNGASGALYV